jgi:hypothetical protein
MSSSMRFVGVVPKCFRSTCVGLLLLAGSVLSAQNPPQGVKNCGHRRDCLDPKGTETKR